MILKIKKYKVTAFNKFSLNLNFNGIASTFSFLFYLSPDNELHKELAHVGHYHKCTVEHNGEVILTGRLISKKFKSNGQTHLMQVSGYSLSGVLQDSSIPIESFPLQSDGLSLKEIANKLTNPFGITAIIGSTGTSIVKKEKSFIEKGQELVDDVMSSVIGKTEADIGSSPAEYLGKLASERNLVLTSTAGGNILFTRGARGKAPILDFEPSTPAIEYDLDFNGQAMHSDITVVKEPDADGGNAGQSTVKNPFVPFTFRPKVIVQSSGTDIDTLAAAKTARASELSALKLKIKLSRWDDIFGKLIKPNNIITIRNPELSIFEKSKFFIESVNITEDQQNGQMSTLNCVVPAVYDGSEPVYIFEEIE